MYNNSRLLILFLIILSARKRFITLPLRWSAASLELYNTTSNANVTGMKNPRKDSVVYDRAVATTARSRKVDNIIAELQDAIAHLTLFGLEDFIVAPESDTNSSGNLVYTSEFETYCVEHGIDQPYPDNHIPFRTFLYNKTLEPCSEDLENYPGIQHAATLLLRDSEAENGDNFDRLDEDLQDMLINVLNCRFADDLARDRFVPDMIISDGRIGKEWVITSQLCNISGSYNRGVYLVSNAADSDSQRRIMKTLPSPAHYPDFASREIWILHTLECGNIIRFFDGRVPEGRHETGWMVTEYCDKGTLKNLVEKYVEASASIPELFVWDILESLVRAVVYLHHGPNLLNEFDEQKFGSKPLKPKQDRSWDPVYHRDIILANVFCTSSTGDMSNYPIVKLGDFGCAMRQSEVETKDNNEYPWSKETPIMDAEYEPPEGQYATKAVDVYQIGLLVWCIVQNTTSPFSLDEEATLPANLETSNSAHYSAELRHLLKRCTKMEPADRVDSLHLLHLIRYYRKLLIFEERLPLVELLP